MDYMVNIGLMLRNFRCHDSMNSFMCWACMIMSLGNGFAIVMMGQALC